ncbi:MAG: MoaD/ThiS family protein [Candidatus Odinarchaeia archaeon]|nr:MAG: beta-grasp domain [Lokiarchaeota virus Fenrir Meg22_1012]URC17287.1 MAG: beta-grasp domain [Lokiarchaeota virus Fenrir Meg22_1214]
MLSQKIVEETILGLTEENKITLYDLLLEVLSPETISKSQASEFFAYFVNGKKVDIDTKIGRDDDVKILPLFAGGN